MKLPKLADVVAQDLRTSIVRGIVKEGDELPPLERLAARFGVSLAVVREAVRILETENLVEIRRGAKGGVSIKTPTLEVVARSVGLYLQHQKVTVDDLLTARLGIEPFAVANLAGHPTPKIIRALEERIAAAEECLEDPVRFSSAATAFHQAIVALAGNRTLSVVHAALLNLVEAELISLALRGEMGAGRIGQRQKSVKSYYRLLNLIKAADAVGAERHWTQHLINQAKALLSLDSGKLIIDLFAPPALAPLTPLSETRPANKRVVSRAVPKPAKPARGRA